MSGISGVNNQSGLAAALLRARNGAADRESDGDADDQLVVPSTTSGGALGSASDLKDQVLAAIAKVLQDAPGDASPQDLLKAIQQSVADALKQGGGASSAERLPGSGSADSNQATALLSELLQSGGANQTQEPNDLFSILTQATTSSEQSQLASLIQQLPPGFNFSAVA